MMRRLAAVVLVLACCLTTAGAAEAFPQDVIQASGLLSSMEVEAQAALLVDESYGKILYQQNAHVRRYPASITKVMTCLLAIEAVDRGDLALDTQVTAGADLYTGIGAGGSTQNLQEGEILTVEQLLYCALLPSANEACNVLAQAVSGDVPAFVSLMNRRAQELGMADTQFANTHGYHDANHYTTAYDIYLMVRQALEYPLFREIVSSPTYAMPATNLSKEREMKNSNALLSADNERYYLAGTIGVKTGSTPEAGYCLASAAQRDGRTLVAVVLGAERLYRQDGTAVHLQFRESKRLLEWGLDRFGVQTLIQPGQVLGRAAVPLSGGDPWVDLVSAGSVTAFLPADITPGELTLTLDCPDAVEAPVQAGQVLGTAKLSCGETVYGTVELTAAQGAPRSLSLYLAHRLDTLLNPLWVRLVLALAGVVLVAAVVCLLRPGRRKPRPRGRRVASGQNRPTP